MQDKSGGNDGAVNTPEESKLEFLSMVFMDAFRVSVSCGTGTGKGGISQVGSSMELVFGEFGQNL